MKKRMTAWILSVMMVLSLLGGTVSAETPEETIARLTQENEVLQSANLMLQHAVQSLVEANRILQQAMEALMKGGVQPSGSTDGDGTKSEETKKEDVTVKPSQKKEEEPYFICDSEGGIPEETGKRKLSDNALAKMTGLNVWQAAEKITTLADAYAWLNAAGYTQGGMDGGLQIDSSFKGYSGDKNLNWLEMSAALHVLLDGDYEDVGTLICVVHPRVDGWKFWHISFNYVMVDGVYYITSSADHLDCNGRAAYEAHTVKTNDLKLFKDALALINGDISDLITLAAYGLTTERIQYKMTENPISVTFPGLTGVRYLYQANTADIEAYEKQKAADEAAEWERWQRHAATLKISDYNLPEAIGKTTLTYKQAAALVGKEPAEIAKKVKTVGDVLQYMIAARFGYNSPSAFTPWYGGWGFDAPGDDQLRQNYGCCCGGYANAVSYLIDGDYEKAGTLRWVGNGNHTISWVYTGGKYYVFDFTQLCNGGNYNNTRADFRVLDDLRDYYDVFPASYERHGPKTEIAIMVAFEVDGGAMYPTVWQDPPRFTGLTYPKEAEGKIILIRQKDADAGLRFEKPPVGVIPRYDG